MWSHTVNLYYSDDFFATKKLALAQGNSIIKTENYIFVAKANKKELVEIYVGTVLHGFLNFQECILPRDASQSKAFTVMDTSESVVFLHIQNHGPTIPLGSIFISDGTGKYYTISIENVIKGSDFVDFEKVNSLEGVFIANRYDVDHSHDYGGLYKDSKGKGKQGLTDEKIQEKKMENSRKN
jgi:hypothetical protein